MATTTKTTTKTVKKPITNKAVKTSKLSVAMFDIEGKSAGTITLPEKVFGAKINKILIAQAIRVYLTNQRAGTANTKTRGKVSGGGKKPWKQKGTGRARAGSTRSPIWVGGGTTHGPINHPYSMTMPRKMRLAALASALSQKTADGQVVALKGLESLPAKTAKISKVISILPKSAKYLILVDKKHADFALGARNLPNVSIAQAVDLTTYNLANNSTLVLTPDSLKVLEQRWK